LFDGSYVRLGCYASPIHHTHEVGIGEILFVNRKIPIILDLEWISLLLGHLLAPAELNSVHREKDLSEGFLTLEDLAVICAKIPKKVLHSALY